MQYALVLTGKILSGFTPESAWPKLAAYLRMEPDRLAQLVARAPLIVKQEENLSRLKSLKDGIVQAGAEAEIFASDGRPALSVVLDGDNTQYGPIPSALVDRLVKSGQWAADAVRVAEAGATEWRRYLQPAAPAAFGPAAAPASAGLTYGTVVAAPAARSAPLPASNPVQQRREPKPAWTTIPAGAATHAGFWRRCAALALDMLIWIPIGLLLVLLMVVLAFIPIFGPVLSLLACLGVWFWYFPVQESSDAQATFGKRALGIKVVDRYGESIGLGRAFWRHFSRFAVILTLMVIQGAVMYRNLSPALAGLKNGTPPDTTAIFNTVFNSSFLVINITINLILYASYMMAGWTRRKQTLYDMLAGTFIVFNDVTPGYSPRQRPPMPWYGWILNILPAIFLVSIIAAIPKQITAAREMPIQIKMMEVMAAAETISSQSCQAGVRPLPNPSLGTVEITPGIAGVCRLSITLSDSANMPDVLRGKKIELIRGNGSWSCSSTVPAKYMPPSWFCQ